MEKDSRRGFEVCASAIRNDASKDWRKEPIGHLIRPPDGGRCNRWRFLPSGLG
jgi:hypothetical protein